MTIPPASPVASSATTSSTRRQPICAPWSAATEWLHGLIKSTIVRCSLHAARYPVWYIVGLPTLSIALLVIGFLTNFELELDIEAILSPTGSQPALNRDWVFSNEGFPDKVREVVLLLHKDGDNVLTIPAMERVFQSVQVVLDTEGYEQMCQQGTYVDFEGHQTCRFYSVTGFFEDHQLSAFQDQIHSDAELRHALSQPEMENGSPVYHNAILGNLEMDPQGNLTFAQSYVVIFFLPDGDAADAFEEKMFQSLSRLRKEWIQQDQQNGGTPILNLDLLSVYATQMEYQRAIQGDLYLIPIVALLMCSFVSLTFFSFGWGTTHAKSRTLLGSAAVYTITFSFLAGNGLMFICGVPFSPVTQILPFVVFGVGLDDTFIITGAYLRTNPSLDVVERIRITMEEVAHSIALTTITTIFAFLLGLGSALPGVQWLCLYAFTTIAIDFYYQVTLYIACMVLDERRIQNGKRDICFWMPEKNATTNDNGHEEGKFTGTGLEQGGTIPFADLPAVNQVLAKTDILTQDESSDDTDTKDDSHADYVWVKSIPEQITSQYADFLLQPSVKVLVLVVFAALLAGCSYSASLLTQEFKIGDFVPKDSSLKGVTYSLFHYASVVRPIGVYFRDVDQTDPAIQEQMVNYVNDLEALDSISSIQVEAHHSGFTAQVNPFCWVKNAYELSNVLVDSPGFSFVQNMTFLEKLDLALANPIVRELYGRDIVRDETGNITASRCWLFLSNFDLDSVEAQIAILNKQRAVGAEQPINQGKSKGSWPFFFYDDVLFYWASYDVAVQELFSTIRSGVIALVGITLVLIPHWTAVFFVTPMILMLNATFLGTLQILGLHINGIFYFCVLVSIGLLVDYLLHILLKYYETSPDKSRDERVKETLETMGTSILLGGTTTFLGVVPLFFSTTKIFMIVCLSFLAMVVLGMAYGLILFPVILSLVGPKDGLVSEKPGTTKRLATDSGEALKVGSEEEGNA